jgi:hypothetical protein
MAFSCRVAEVATWARVHRSGQHKAGRKRHGDRRSSDGHHAVLQRLAEETADAPRATTFDSVSLGSSVMDALVLDGRRETTTVAAGAYNNKEPMVITREIWHSPELDLDVSITKGDPRGGTFARKIEILSRSEPDPEYFAIPSDFTFVDNRPVVKK